MRQPNLRSSTREIRSLALFECPQIQHYLSDTRDNEYVIDATRDTR